MKKKQGRPKGSKNKKAWGKTDLKALDNFVKANGGHVYKATLKVLGKTHESTGVTAREAIEGIKAPNCKGRGILTMEKGEVKKERIIMPALVWKLFNGSRIMREIALKNASMMFDGI